MHEPDKEVLQVSILVLVDLAREFEMLMISGIPEYVSILVLVDLARECWYDGNNRFNGFLLILVLVDLAREFEYCTIIRSIKSMFQSLF